MGFLFWFVFFAIVGGLFNLTKSFWKDGKKFQAIVLAIVTIIVFSGFSIYRQIIMENKRAEYKKETSQIVTEKQNIPEKKNYDIQEKIETPPPIIKNEYTPEIIEPVKEKTLGDTALDAPRPIRYVSGMQPIRDGEGFYIEFDKSFSNEEYGFICDYLDSKNENELRIAKTDVPTAELNATFDSLTEIQRKELIDSIKKANISQSKSLGANITFLDDGYFNVNGNIVLWVKAVVKNNDLISQTTYCYYVAKNKKIYSIQYFTLDDSTGNEPNDTILTSLNTLRFE